MNQVDFRPSEVIGLEIIANYLKAVGDSYILNRVFRGHASSEWKPVAYAFRPGINGIERKDQLRYWRSMSQRFVSSQPTSELSYLVLAQHYGIPTGLLDWTSNPLIALFFAAQPHEEEADGEVLQTDTTALQSIEKIDSVNIWREGRAAPLFLDTSAMNVRSTAQDSYMTLHTANEPPLAVRSVFRMPHWQKSNVRTGLRVFGLSEERIYADLTVAANSFKSILQDEVELRQLMGDYDL